MENRFFESRAGVFLLRKVRRRPEHGGFFDAVACLLPGFAGCLEQADGEEGCVLRRRRGKAGQGACREDRSVAGKAAAA